MFCKINRVTKEICYLQSFKGFLFHCAKIRLKNKIKEIDRQKKNKHNFSFSNLIVFLHSDLKQILFYDFNLAFSSFYQKDTLLDH
jgi:hypothetical protein